MIFIRTGLFIIVSLYFVVMPLWAYGQVVNEQNGEAFDVPVPKVSLVTFGPGPEIWARFGHNAIRIQQGEYDVLYNFGYFDLNEAGFYKNYALGNMQYYAVPENTDNAYVWYRELNRSIREQPLKLTTEQSYAVADELFRLVQPETRRYPYDYFYNNCSTRVRDVLDAALGYPLRDKTASLNAPHSMRWEALRMVQDDWLLYLGLHIALGSKVDQPISVYDQAFLPEHLATLLNTQQPEHVLEDQSIFAAKEADRAFQPRYYGLALLGLVTSILILLPLLLGPNVWNMLLPRFWLAISGLSGVLLLFLWLGTNHEAAWNNANLLLLLPTNLMLLLMRHRLLEKLAAHLIWVCIVLAVLIKCLPNAQFNLDLMLWFVPAQLSVLFLWFQLKANKRAYNIDNR